MLRACWARWRSAGAGSGRPAEATEAARRDAERGVEDAKKALKSDSDLQARTALQGRSLCCMHAPVM